MKKFRFFLVPLLFAFSLSGLLLFYLKKPEYENNNLPKTNPTHYPSSSFSLKNAPTASLNGEIANITGEVEWQSRAATESSKLENPIQIQQGEKLITGRESAVNLLFKDVADLQIGENSEIDIIQTLPVNIVLNQRSGEVDYSKLGIVPISIRALHLLIENNGRIKVTVDRSEREILITAYDDGSRIFYNNLDFETQELVLDTGDILHFTDNTREAVLR